MTSKRALVVDDSKSARAYLARILERHEIEVDAAESAEAAIEYLARNKPDVIFMDHMMPGMDGFQAVQTIKNNPRTSAIPILMYTSQEGDLYAGQARALGAEGVLPKQIKQSDVTKMLFQLRLVSDRRGSEQTTFARMSQDLVMGTDLLPANESAIVLAPQPPAAVAEAANSANGEGTGISKLLPQMSLEIRAAVDGTLQKELAALRSYISSTLDSQSERIQGDLAAALQPSRAAQDFDTPTLVPERRAWGAIAGWAGWTLAVMATAGAAAMTWTWWQQGGEIAALRTDLQAAYAEVETLRARPEVVSPPAPAAAPESGALPLVPGAEAADPAAVEAATPPVTPVDAVAVPETAASTPPVTTPATALPPAPATPSAAPPEVGAGAAAKTANQAQ
jgi:CheY-like chemotaxis protein